MARKNSKLLSKESQKSEDLGLRPSFPLVSSEFLGKLLCATQAWFSIQDEAAGASLFQDFLYNLLLLFLQQHITQTPVSLKIKMKLTV